MALYTTKAAARDDARAALESAEKARNAVAAKVRPFVGRCVWAASSRAEARVYVEIIRDCCERLEDADGIAEASTLAEMAWRYAHKVDAIVDIARAMAALQVSEDAGIDTAIESQIRADLEKAKARLAS